MKLKSDLMSLSRSERRWLPLLGKTGKIQMGWSCFINQKTYTTVEKIFEGIAAARVKILTAWTAQQWEHLANLSERLGTNFPSINLALLTEKQKQANHFSELFVIDRDGTVLSSTYAPRLGIKDLSANSVAAGL